MHFIDRFLNCKSVLTVILAVLLTVAWVAALQGQVGQIRTQVIDYDEKDEYEL